MLFGLLYNNKIHYVLYGNINNCISINALLIVTKNYSLLLVDIIKNLYEVYKLYIN